MPSTQEASYLPPTDDEILRLWRAGLDTKSIAHEYPGMGEAEVYSLLSKAKKRERRYATRA